MMTKYLLLRDNKQTGPYDLEELRVMGLKAYDLVWVEGKSAAWRYPCEVDGLRAFAPVVEEQPFDRFFKKPSQAGSSNSTALPFIAAVPAKTNTEKEKRTIYVTMPAGRSFPVSRETAPVQSIRIQAQPILVTESAHNAGITKKETLSSSNIERPVSPAVAEEKFSQSREDWKSSGEITPRIHKNNVYKIMRPVGVALCVLILLTAGVFIGMSINKNAGNGAGPSLKMAAYQGPAIDHNGTVSVTNASLPTGGNLSVGSSGEKLPASPDSVATIIGKGNRNDRLKTIPAVISLVAAPVKQTSSLGNKSKNSTLLKNKAGLSVIQKTADTEPLPVKDSASMGLSVVNRDALHRSDIQNDKTVIKSNISNQVSVGANKYSIGTFGGISELQLTVSNHSIYPLDLVVVEVQYIQANKKVFRTENLNFRGVGPGAALMLEAPKSARGIKVQYRITFINSKELGLSYSAI
ncbi:hypothetical protein ACX0G9_21165 [Flavitalea flava]